ncbi:hypothetical protein N9805_05130 [Paracoccaceae bacterium]|nr:hypothetical protein [Paracoccaceae bacterium]
MRKLLAILAVALALPTMSFAESNTGNAKSLSKNDMKGNFTARTFCVDGYKFLITQRYNQNPHFKALATAISLTQFYEERNGKVLPAKC